MTARPSVLQKEKSTSSRSANRVHPSYATDRLILGDSCIPLHEILHATWDAGFRGACTITIFSSDVPDSLYDRDLGDVIRFCRKGPDQA